MAGLRAALWWTASSRVKKMPALYLPLISLRRRPADGTRKRLRSGTDLVIDAFPRSANTFATYAFLESQPGPVVLAHHFHAPAVVRAASRRGIPLLTILREPADAVCSYLLFRASTDGARAFGDYIDYYEAVEEHRDHITVALFESVVSDLGEVIETVNRRHGTSFVPFDHSPDNVRAVHRRITEIGERISRERGSNRLKDTLPIPDASRGSRTETLLDAFARDRRTAARLRRANELYERLRAGTDV